MPVSIGQITNCLKIVVNFFNQTDSADFVVAKLTGGETDNLKNCQTILKKKNFAE